MVTINHIFFLFENRLSCSLSIFGKIYTCCVQKSRKAWNGNSESAINDESCFFFLWRLQTKSPKCMVLLYSQVKAKGPFEERKLFLSAHRDSDSCNIQHITWAGIEFYTLSLCAPLTRWRSLLCFSCNLSFLALMKTGILACVWVYVCIGLFHPRTLLTVWTALTSKEPSSFHSSSLQGSWYLSGPV